MIKSSHCNVDEAIQLMREQGYQLHVAENGEAILRPRPEHTSGRPLKVYNSSAKSLIDQNLVRLKEENVWKVYTLKESGDSSDQLEVANKIMEAYKKLAGTGTRVGDLLCELLHYCHHNKINFEEELNYGNRHFEAEKP